MKLTQFITELRQFPAKAGIIAKNVLQSEAGPLMNALKERSPVDSSFYKTSWFQTKPRFMGAHVVAAVGFRNNDPKAHFMEFGAPPGEAPWYYPKRSKASGKFVKGSGKLTLRNGRVWPGGLNPGHSKTVGGAIDPVIYNNNERQLQITKRIANGILEAIR